MADDPNTPNEPADPPAAAPAATPQLDTSNFVSREDYARLQGQLDALMASQGRVPQAAPQAPAGPQYTDDQLAEMLESGEGRKILEAQTFITQRTMAPFAREFVQFRDATTQTAGVLNREIAEARGYLPHASDPGVKREMDAFLAKLPPDAQANPEAIKLAHAHAVATPENFKRLVDQQVEAELRRRAGGDEPTGTPQSGAPAGRVPATPGSQVPTVSELLGPEAARAIRDQGYHSADEWVRKSQRGRFNTWAEMAKSIQADEAKQSGAANDAVDRSLQ